MSNMLIWILFITIWNSILFYGKDLGISVILFIIPLIGFIYYVLKSQDKIKNKQGLLFIIPIILLSLTYFIFNNNFFKLLNIPVITILFILMYIFTMKPTFNIKDILTSVGSLLIEPLSCISNIFNLITCNLKGKLRLSDNTKKVIKSILIILPIIIVVLVLLSSADQIFGNIFSNIFNQFEKLSIPSIIKNIIGRIIPMIILFFYLSATVNFLLYNFSEIKQEEKESKLKIDNFTIKLLLTILNIIYIVFDIIQIRSLILHQVSMDISYADYARQGFFQLMFVSFINLIIILVSKLAENKKDKKNTKYIKTMNLIMVFLTFIIIISSFMRMYMYETEFGYTLLRLLVYITLITEVILLIPTIIYILNSKFNIVKYYMIILVTVYTVINFINVDYLIANRNVKRYYEKNDIDLYYLKNNHTDNISVLVNLYNETDDNKIKQELAEYFNSLDTKIDGFQEYNLSKATAVKKIEMISNEK